MIFKEQIETYLSGLPQKWADQLTQLLCLIKDQKQEPDCATVKQCETTTTMSDFTVNGTVVSLQYKNEDGVTVTRSFDASQILNQTLDALAPVCLATDEEWASLTLVQRLQLLINSHCECCDGETE